MGVKCKCGTINPDNARFCYNDGEPLDSSTRPTTLSLGSGSASSEQELLNLIDENWEEAKVHLYSERLITSLSNMGWLDLAAKAEDIVDSTSNKDEGLEYFTEALGAPVPEPYVSATSLDFGSIEQGRSLTLSFEVQNATRGFLKGTINCKAPGASLSVREFGLQCGESIMIAVTIDTEALHGQKQYREELTIQSHGGGSKVSLSYYVSAPIGQVLEPTALFALLGATLMLIIRGIPVMMVPESRNWLVRSSDFDFVFNTGLPLYFAAVSIVLTGCGAYIYHVYFND